MHRNEQVSNTLSQLTEQWATLLCKVILNLLPLCAKLTIWDAFSSGQLDFQGFGLSTKSLQHISSSYNITWMLFQHVILHKLTFWWAVQFTEYIDMFGNLLSHFSFHFLWYKIMVYRHIECVLVLRSSIKINGYSIFTDILLDIFIISVNTWYAPSLEKLHHSL